MAEIKEFKNRMVKTAEVLSAQFDTVRAGRANAAVLDQIEVDYYGTPTPIRQIASISSPDARTLLIQPWDGSTLKLIEKAILTSELGINPQNDGRVFRLVFPQLTEERRKELAKQVRKYGEEGKVALRNIRRDSKYLLSDKEEELFARMNISGASAWESLRDNLTSSVKVEYNGGVTNLSAIRNLAYDPDPAVRKSAYEAELACYDKIKDSVAFALNSIKLQVINECQVRGYASPLDKALYQSRMKRETLEALLGAMDEYMPKFWQYLRAKAKALGYENGLPWYELFAPMGKSDKKYTTQDAKDYLLNIFGGFDSQLHDMVERAFDEAWIDFYPRNGKVGGAFDCGVPSAKQSRVLTNFDGAFGDIVTLAHELGHAFHDQQVFTHPLICQEYSMPVAETASTFNEVLTVTAAIQAAQDKDEKLALIESQLSDACQIICDIYSRFLFESSVFEARPQEFLDADRLCQLMLEAQKKAYGDGLDQTCLHPYMWLCKGHYYSGSLSFYNFPYAFGGLFARGLYAKYQQEGEKFVPLYKEMLHATSVNDVEDTAKIAGIDLTDKAFWRQGLQSLADEIDLFCDLVK